MVAQISLLSNEEDDIERQLAKTNKFLQKLIRRQSSLTNKSIKRKQTRSICCAVRILIAERDAINLDVFISILIQEW